MRVHISTTAKLHITEIKGERSPGDGAGEVWRKIKQEMPIAAGIAQEGDQVTETRQMVFNPQHVVYVAELDE